MRNIFRLFLTVALVVALSSAAVQALEFKLTEEEVNDLGEEAREVYQKAQRYLDRIDYGMALGCFIQAKDLAAGHTGIRFEIGEIAKAEARKQMGEKAVELLRKAESAYTEIVAMEKIKQHEKKRAQTYLNKVKKLIASQAERDARREEIARKAYLQRKKELSGDKGKGKEKGGGRTTEVDVYDNAGLYAGKRTVEY